MTSDLNNFIFTGKLMDSLFQMILSFVVIDVGRVSLLLICMLPGAINKQRAFLCANSIP